MLKQKETQFNWLIFCWGQCSILKSLHWVLAERASINKYCPYPRLQLVILHQNEVLKYEVDFVCVCVKLLQSHLTFGDAMCCSLLGSLSMGVSRQENWRGLPCPPPGDLPDPGIEPASLISPALAGRFFTTSTAWETPWARLYVIKREGSIQLSKKNQERLSSLRLASMVLDMNRLPINCNELN